MLRTLQIFVTVLLITGCGNQQNPPPQPESGSQNESLQSVPFERDLEDILEDGKLTAITTYSSTSYFLYKGKPMGFEYELLKSFTDYLGVDLEIIVAKNIDSLFTNL